MKDAKAGGWLGNLMLVFISAAMALVAIEFAVRLALGHSIVLFPRNHAAAHYGPYVLRSMAPNAVFWHQSIDGRWQFQTNNKGFRDTKDYAYDKPGGILRVLVLGDSHTAGFEVHQTEVFSSILEIALRRSGLYAEVLNTGISGMGTAEHLAFVEHEGLRYDPDVIILAFFRNDYSDSARASLYRIESGELVTASSRYAPGVGTLEVINSIPGTKWLSENSYAYSYFFNTVWRYIKIRAVQRARDDHGETFVPSTLFEQAVVASRATDGEQALVLALLNRIAALGHENQAIVVLVDIPAIHGNNSFQDSLEPTTRSAVQSSFDYILSAEEYLDGRPGDELIHVPNGHRHISADTHRRLGEALASLIRNLLDDS
jgi:hypothetical protein